MPSRAVDAVVANELPEPEKGAYRLLIAHTLVLEKCGWVQVSPGNALTQIDGAMFEVDRLDLGDGRRLLATWRERVVLVFELGVLRRKPIAVDDDAALRGLEPAFEGETGDSSGLVQELRVGHRVEPKELPPIHPVFASVPLE